MKKRLSVIFIIFCLVISSAVVNAKYTALPMTEEESQMDVVDDAISLGDALLAKGVYWAAREMYDLALMNAKVALVFISDDAEKSILQEKIAKLTNVISILDSKKEDNSWKLVVLELDKKTGVSLTNGTSAEFNLSGPIMDGDYHFHTTHPIFGSVGSSTEFVEGSSRTFNDEECLIEIICLLNYNNEKFVIGCRPLK